MARFNTRARRTRPAMRRGGAARPAMRRGGAARPAMRRGGAARPAMRRGGGVRRMQTGGTVRRRMQTGGRVGRRMQAGGRMMHSNGRAQTVKYTQPRLEGRPPFANGTFINIGNYSYYCPPGMTQQNINKELCQRQRTNVAGGMFKKA